MISIRTDIVPVSYERLSLLIEGYQRILANVIIVSYKKLTLYLIKHYPFLFWFSAF